MKIIPENAFADRCKVLTLTDIETLIEGDKSVGSTRRRDDLSALRSLGEEWP